MTTLIPMRQEEFGAFFEEGVRSYAADNVASGRWSPDDALGLARVETERLLPQGLATPKNYLYDIQDEGLKQSVGFVWFAVAARGGTELAYVYQIQVKPEFRRKGHARAALLERKPCTILWATVSRV